MSSGEMSALEGRHPVLPGERLFQGRASFFASCTVFSLAIWVFMIGAGLATLGDIRYVIPAYTVGTIIGLAIVVVSAGFPSYRYGIDTIDASKATFGTRGIILPLVGMIFCGLAWACVVTSFIAKGGASIVATVTHHEPPPELRYGLLLFLVTAVWLLVGRGPKLLERVNNIAAPILILLAAIMLVLLGNKIGWDHLWVDRVAAGGRLFHDRSLAVVSGVELGMGTSLGLWPFMGGLTRLLKQRDHMIHPAMVGANILGVCFGSGISAIVADALPNPDPISWFFDLGGLWFGGLVAVGILISNIAVVGLLIYFTAVAAQQISWVSRLRWSIVSMVMLVPVGLMAIRAETVMAAVLSIAAYQGMMFVGFAGPATASYMFVLKEKLDLTSIFCPPDQGVYARHFGLNWVSLASAVAGWAVYLLVYDPISLAPSFGFYPLGASVPAFLVSFAMFFVLNAIDVRIRRASISAQAVRA